LPQRHAGPAAAAVAAADLRGDGQRRPEPGSAGGPRPCRRAQESRAPAPAGRRRPPLGGSARTVRSVKTGGGNGAASRTPVMTSRVEGDPLDEAWRTEAAGASLTTIDLGPLPSEDARALAEPLIAANTAFAKRCVERAAGNPLFLDQLLRHA